MNDDLVREDVQQAVDAAAAEVLAEAGVTRPPVDALALARRLSLTVRTGGGRPRRSAGVSEVVVPSDAAEEARQWAAARAVGELRKPDLLRRLGATPGEKPAPVGVSLPNLFAGRLLLPTAWFAADAAACDYDLLELKRRYATAAFDLLAWRLLDLPAACVVTLVDDEKVYRRRGNAGRVPKALAPAERACVRAAVRDGAPHRVRGGGWTVQGWPVPRAGGGRVVLRSVPDEA
jgi:hypothetical protein